MDPFTVFTMIATTLGHTLSSLQGLQKNVVDDVMMEIIKKLPKGKQIGADELKKSIKGLTVNKTHIPGYKKIRIKYEDD